MKLLRHLLLIAFAFVSSLANAFTVLPADGLWSVVAEQNLSIGRAFNFEISESLLVVTMYAYNAQGAPTFYAGAAPLSASNVATVTLSEPQGGTCLGCAPTNGRLLSTPGLATFEFTSSTTGFVILPGEARKAIIKGAITRPYGPEAFRGAWAFTYVITTSSATAETPVFIHSLGPSGSGNGLMADSTLRNACEFQTSGPYAGYVICIKLNVLGTAERFSINRVFGNNMDGNWYLGSTVATAGPPSQFTSRRFMDAKANDISLKKAPSDYDASALRFAMDALVESLSRE